MPEETPKLTEQEIIDSLAKILETLMNKVQASADGLGIDGKQFHILNVVTADLFALCATMNICTIKPLDSEQKSG